MRTSQFLIAVLVALFNIGFIHAQTVSQPHKKLSQHHETILKKTSEMNNATTLEAKKKAQEAGASLDSAQAQHEAIQKEQSPAEKTISQQHHDIIAKNHAHAIKYNESIKQELARPNPDKAKVRQNTLNISNEVNEAKKHHEEIKKKTGVK